MTVLWLIAIWVGLTIGNYVYQYFTKKDWKKAYDISYNQIVPFVVIGIFKQ